MPHAMVMGEIVLKDECTIEDVEGRREDGGAGCTGYLGTLGYSRNRATVADQLRLEGRYPGVADRAARRAILAAAAPAG